MTDVPGEGFQVGAAFISVSPEGEDFQPQVEAIVHETDVVVTVPVIPDGAGFRDKLAAEVDTAGAEVTVPVRPDTTGFRMLLQEELADLMPVSVPVRPNTAGFTSAAESEGEAAGKAAGSAFSEGFDGSGRQLSLFDASEIDAEATTAGEEAGGAFRGGFDSAAGEQLALFNTGEIESEATGAGREAATAFREGLATGGAGEQLALFDPATLEEKAAAAGSASGRAFTGGFDASTAAASPIAGMLAKGEGEAAAAGEVSASGFGARFKSALSGVPLFGGAASGIARDAETTAETSGEGFVSRFGSKMSGLVGAFSSTVPGFVREAAQGADEVGTSFMGKLKGVISGDMPAMEALIPAAFVAASAVMASKFQAAMEQIHTQAGVGQSAIHGLSNDVLNLASKVGESPDSLSQALYHVESAFQSVGITGPKAMALVKTAAEGARVGGADLVDVTNALDSAMVSHISGIHSYGQAMGALNAIVGSGDMKMQDLADAMGTGIMAVAKSYGQSIYQVGAALATFGDNNIRGAKAATDLRMAMQAIQAPVATGAAALQHLGLTQNQLGQEMEHHGLSAALQMFVQHLKDSKVPVADWGEYMTEIFGKRAGVGIGVLVNQLGRLQSKFPDIERGAHDFGNAWAATQKTTDQKMHEMLAGFESLMIRIGQVLLPVIGDIFGAITKILPPVEHFGEMLAHLVSPIVGAFFTGLAATFHLLTGPLKDVTIGVLAFAGAMKAITLATELYDAVMAMGPFGWIVLISAAIVLLAGLIIKYHKQIFDVIIGTWRKIEDFFTKDFDIVKPVMKAFDAIKKFVTKSFDAWWKSHGKEIKEVWNAIWESIKKPFEAFWGFITRTTSGSWSALVGLFHDAEGLLSTAWKAIWLVLGAYFKAAWDVMAAYLKVMLALFEMVIKTAWDIIVGIFNVALDLITGHWSKAWNDALTMLTQVWNNISAFFTTVWSAISALFDQELNIITGFLSGAWDAITSDISTAWDAIATWFDGWWQTEVSGWEAIISKVELIFKEAWDTVWGGIKTGWGDIEKWFSSWWDDEISGWKKIIATIVKIYNDCWKTVKSDAGIVWGDIMKFFKNTWHDINKGFDDVVSGIKTAWGKLKAIFDDPVKFLVDTVYDDGIAALWNAVARKIPDIPKMPIVHMAGGGKLPGYGGGDKVPALLESGETVVSKEHSKQLAGAFQAVGVPGYSKGGAAGSPGGLWHDITGAGSNLWHGLTGGIKKVVASVETGSITALKDALRAVVKTSATGLLGKVMTGVPETLITDMVKGVIHKIESIIPGGGGSVPGGGHLTAAETQIAGWWTGAGGPGGETAKIAAAITGAESSFNVKAVQQGQPYNSTGWGLWQITPGNSEPSVGIDDQLLTGPTNAKAAVLKYRGAGSSFSPWTTYMDGAYKAFLVNGGLIPAGGARTPQTRWYDSGGYLMPGATMAMNNTGQPEMVLPSSLTEAMSSPGGPIGRLAQTLTNPGGPVVTLDKALTDQGAPMAYLTRTLINPGGPMASLQKTMANPGGPMAKLGKTAADPGGPIAKLGKGVTDPGGPMAKVGKGVASGGTVDGLATALNNADGPMSSLAGALNSYVAAHPGKGGGGGSGGGSGGGHPGGGHPDKAHHPAGGHSYWWRHRDDSDNPSGGGSPQPGGGHPIVNVNYYGTQHPTPEQHQAMMLKLGAAIGVA